MPSEKFKYHRRLQDLQNERTEFESHWLDLDHNLAPKRVRLDGTDNNDGRKGYKAILDSTVLRARRVFTAGMLSGTTSPVRPWYKLSPPDPDMRKNIGVKRYLDELERRQLLILAGSNFYQIIQHAYDRLGTFGTQSFSMVEHPETLIWFMNQPLGEFYLSRNQYGQIDTHYRETIKTVRQIAQQFGLQNASQFVRSSYNSGQYEEEVEVVHVIEPNSDRIAGRIDNQNMAYRSVWFEQQQNEHEFLFKGGFNEFPAMPARWYAETTDTYGVDCPGMAALSNCRQLYHEQKMKAVYIDKSINPPLQAPAKIKQHGRVSMVPGSITWHDDLTGAGAVRPLYQPTGNLSDLALDINDVRSQVNQSYFVDLFLMISQQDDVRTATEIAARQEEKLLMLGPPLHQIQNEILRPVIDRLFNIMERQGLNPEPPPELDGVPLEPVYTGILAQAQQMVGVGSLDRFVNTITATAQLDPSVLDTVDTDALANTYAEILDVPPEIMRDEEAIARIRQQRQQALQAQQNAELAAQGAAAARDASQIDPETRSALERVLTQ